MIKEWLGLKPSHFHSFSKAWYNEHSVQTIDNEANNPMTERKKAEKANLETFIENVNKKDKKRNGLKIHFAFVNRKR
jgi:hypothetical protein